MKRTKTRLAAVAVGFLFTAVLSQAPKAAEADFLDLIVISGLEHASGEFPVTGYLETPNHNAIGTGTLVTPSLGAYAAGPGSSVETGFQLDASVTGTLNTTCGSHGCLSMLFSVALAGLVTGQGTGDVQLNIYLPRWGKSYGYFDFKFDSTTALPTVLALPVAFDDPFVIQAPGTIQAFPFIILFNLSVDSGNLGLADVLDTASLSFGLPQGATLTTAYATFTPSSVPAPATLLLLGAGLAGLAGVTWRRHRRK